MWLIPIQNLLQKFWVNRTKIERAADNCLFLKLLAELAMIVTSEMMTNGIQNLLPKFWVNQTKIERAADNFLFLKLLAELAMIFTS